MYDLVKSSLIFFFTIFCFFIFLLSLLVKLFFSDFFFFFTVSVLSSVFKSIDLALENSYFVIAPSLKRLFNLVNSSAILEANEILQVNKNILVNIKNFFIFNILLSVVI